MTKKALLAALLAAGGCRGTTPDAPGRPGITIVSPALAVSDTVTAELAQPLVVEVRDSTGKPRPGVVVRFDAGTVALRGRQFPALLLSGGAGDFRPAVQTTTDSTGRAMVRVRLGRVATAASVRIQVPTLGLSAGTSFTVTPGATANVAVAPEDSAVYVGGGYPLRVTAEDRFGNPRPVSSVAAVSTAPSVVADGPSVTGASIGRARVEVTADGRPKSVWVSVVPRATLLAAQGDGIYSFGLDGSALRRVVQAEQARSPRWFPDGERFVYSTGLSHGWVADLDGRTRPLVSGDNPLTAELWAHPSRDGKWVYFGGYAGMEFRGYPYRVREDGTGLQLVPGFAADDYTQGHPSPSPDGERVVYFREEGDSRDVSLRVLDMRRRRVVLRNVEGHSAEWSHGDSIAYLEMYGGEAGSIRLMSSTGAGHRRVGSGTSYAFGIDWSPDDQWIVARDASAGRLEIIRVATGERIPLGYSSGMYDPAWKP